jgi:hypothetical protein
MSTTHYGEAPFCNSQLIEQQLVSKHRSKLSQGVLFLQDNISLQEATITNQKLTDLHFEVLRIQAYSPNVAPSDYCLFHNLKKHLNGRNFSSAVAVTCGYVFLQHSQTTFFGWVKEVRTTKS